MSFQAELLAEFDRDLQRGARLLSDDYTSRVQRSPATPRDTGKLAGGIRQTDIRTSRGRVEITIASTFRSDDGADVGTILDLSTGRLVKASDKGKQAFGPFAGSRGPRTFIREFRVTTAHVGWWEKANTDTALRSASGVLASVNL